MKNVKISKNDEVVIDDCDALHDLVLFVQFKKRKTHRWRNVIFSQVAGY